MGVSDDSQYYVNYLHMCNKQITVSNSSVLKPIISATTFSAPKEKINVSVNLYWTKWLCIQCFLPIGGRELTFQLHNFLLGVLCLWQGHNHCYLTYIFIVGMLLQHSKYCSLNLYCWNAASVLFFESLVKPWVMGAMTFQLCTSYA